MTKEALTLALEALEAVQPECDDFHHNKKEMHDWSETCKPLERYNQAITAIKEALAQQSNISELKEKTANHNVDCLCADCSMLDDLEDATAQPEHSATNGEPVAWRYKPAREDNPRWEYTTEHPLDMGDGYIRPSLVEYCKCIEPLYAKEKPKLMLEKFREMEDLLEEPAQQEPATKEKIREAIVFNLPLYTTPPQRKPLTDEEIGAILEGVNAYGTRLYTFARAIEAKLKEKNT